MVDVEVIVSKKSNLSEQEGEVIRAFFVTHSGINQGKRGWTGPPAPLNLIPSAKHKHGRSQAYQAAVWTEVVRLVSIGLSEPVKSSARTATSIAVPKANGTIRFVTNFRCHNAQLQRKPYPIQVIPEVLQSLRDSRYATKFNLNMGYNKIYLDD